ncbi:MAG: hypothetical protein ACI82G_000339 [Bradymonadia bacterium]|jgi:hypothetical protein
MPKHSIESTALHCLSGVYAVIIGFSQAGIETDARPSHLEFKAVGGMPGAFAKKSGKTLIRVHLYGDDGDRLSTFGDATWMCASSEVAAFKQAWVAALHSLQSSYANTQAESADDEMVVEIDAEEVWALCHEHFGEPSWDELSDDQREAFAAHIEDQCEEDSEEDAADTNEHEAEAVDATTL